MTSVGRCREFGDSRYRRNDGGLSARLDAHYFHLYGLSRDAAADILSTFPIIQRQDRSPIRPLPHQSDLILAYMNALTAGDPQSTVTP